MKVQVKSEIMINAPVAWIWALITDIDKLPKLNKTVISVSGIMDQLNRTRTCEIDNNGKRGVTTERLVQITDKRTTLWKVEDDNMGRVEKLPGLQYATRLDAIADTRTSVICETSYCPATLLVRILNLLIIRKKIARAQEGFLGNLKVMAEVNFI